MGQIVKSQKAGKEFKAEIDGTFSMELDTGDYFVFGGKRIYSFTTAITANTTVTTAPAGSLAVTTHATGLASVFVSDGSKWQFLTNA